MRRCSIWGCLSWTAWPDPHRGRHHALIPAGPAVRAPLQGARTSNGLRVDETFGKVRQFLVCRPFLFQRLLEQLRGEGEPKYLRVGPCRSVVGDLEVLDALRRRNQLRIADVAIDLAGEQPFALFDDRLDRC
jgi:hypothetical protein